MCISNGSYNVSNIDHCPWMWNCIGHYNRRYFVGFLTNLSVALLLMWILNLSMDENIKKRN